MLCNLTMIEEISSYFTFPCISYRTQGDKEGVIIRFDFAYLKIYDDRHENQYIVKVYNNFDQEPIRIDHVKSWDMKRYAQNLFKHTTDGCNIVSDDLW